MYPFFVAGLRVEGSRFTVAGLRVEGSRVYRQSLGLGV